jgi:mono/diheme cytochrome c family protein
MRRAVICSLVFVTLAFTLAAAQNPGGNAEASKLKNPVAASPESVKAGQALFQKNCRFCHGATGTGDGPMAPEGSHPANLTDDKWDRGPSDGEIFTVIREGAGPQFVMKGFKSTLSEKDVWNLVNYIRTLQAK